MPLQQKKPEKLQPAIAATKLLEQAIDKLRRSEFEAAADEIQNVLTIISAVVGPVSNWPAPSAEPDRCAKIRIKTDDRNYKGKGTLEYRLVVHQGRTYYAAQAPVGIVNDGEVELPVGTIVIHFRRWYGDSTVTKPKITYVASVVLDDDPEAPLAYEDGDDCPVRHVGVKPGDVHVLEIKETKKRVQLKPASIVVLLDPDAPDAEVRTR